jgi:hypothetical protein
MSLSNDELLSNIKRQAKRLSKSINIPLRQAQGVLSISVYQCDDWVHLRDSLKLDSFDNQLLLLASLQPNSEDFLYKLLDTHMNNIEIRLQNELVDKKTNEETRNIIINIFGIEPSDFKGEIK